MNAHAHNTGLTSLRLTLHAQAYRPVPVSGPDMKVEAAGKRPMMAGWQTHCLDPSADDIERWARDEPRSTNTGLLCGQLAGVDIDVLQPGLAETIAASADTILGPTRLRRIGQAPKTLLCFRHARPLDKMQTPALFFTADPAEKPTKVEVLGRGQQFVGFGVHPDTGRPYLWPDASPLDVPLAEIPEAEEGALRRFLAEAEAILRRAGAQTRAEQREDAQRRESADRDQNNEPRASTGGSPERAVHHAEVADALARIPNDLDYDEWVKVGFALYDGLGEAGRDLWERWSATYPGADAKVTAAKWPTFAKGHSVKVGTLFWMAEQRGWAPWSGMHRKAERAAREQQADATGLSGGARTASGETGEFRYIKVVAAEMPRVLNEMEDAILAAGLPIYVRAGSLVRPITDLVPASKGRMTTAARLKPLCPDSAADILAGRMTFQKRNERKKGWTNIDPPRPAVAAFLARDGSWRLPAIAGVITTPTLRPDGSLLDRPGYDPATRLFLVEDRTFAMPPVPENPTRVQGAAARALLQSLLIDFPFASPVDLAVALSGILTAVVRGGLDVAPLHAYRSSTPGTGKSFLVDVASAIATGRPCPVIAAGATPEETEKRLGALLRDGVPIVSLDNVNGELGGDMLCQMVERPLVRVRILGKSEAPELECRSAVFATGNGLTLVGDMTRRALVCTLDAGIERPEKREFDFDPVARVLADRGRYVAAALTLVRAYRAAGSPKVCGPLGSYGEWTAAVRAPLVWLGEADPAASMEAARAEDPELAAIRELFGHWRQHLRPSEGYTTSSLIKSAVEKRAGADFNFNTAEFVFPEFRDLLLRQAGEGGAINSRRLGKWLSKISGRVVDGHRIEMKVDGSHGNRFALCQPRRGAPEGG